MHGSQEKFTFVTRYILWKLAKNPSPWMPIEDTPKTRQDAIQQGAAFFTWLAIDRLPEDGQPEPVRFGDLVLDFDSKDDPGRCLQEVRWLIQHLAEIYQLDPHCINFFASGGKGFHAVIPASVFGAENGDPFLHLIYKRFVADWVSSLDLHTVDLSMYSGGKGKPFRIENIRRENGRYKIPLSMDEIRTLSMEDITRLTESPRTIEEPDGADADPIQDLVEQFRKHHTDIHREESERANKPEPDANFEAMKGKVSPCINYILEKNPKTSKTTFNLLVVNLVKYFQSAGFDYQSAVLMAGNFIRNYPHSGTYTTPTARQKEFRKQWIYNEGRGNQFRCGYVLGMAFPGSGFDCSTCPLKKAAPDSDIPVVNASTYLDGCIPI